MEEQGLVVYKENFFIKLRKTFRKLFFKGKIKKMLAESTLEQQNSKIKLIQSVEKNIPLEILNARSAFRKYVINNNKDISKDILNYIIEKLEENASKIRKIIKINKDIVTYNSILSIVQNELNYIEEFKQKNPNTECYQVPIGVIGVECISIKNIVSNMVKAISSRNSIIILRENYNKYSTECLILLIIQECLKNFYIDDNLIQIIDSKEFDTSKLDKLIKLNNDIICKEQNNSIYLYLEDTSFETDAIDELEKLYNNEKYNDFNIQIIKGKFEDIIDFLNKETSYAVCMYTHNSPKSYKFINWINSKNIFINTGIRNCKNIEQNNNIYYTNKYVLHNDIFNNEEQ